MQNKIGGLQGRHKISPRMFMLKGTSSLQDSQIFPLHYLGLRPRLSYFGPSDLFEGTIISILKDVGNAKGVAHGLLQFRAFQAH